MKKKIQISVTLGAIAGLLIILTGILTALKITPSITAEGLEIGLGAWRVLAGTVIVGFSFFARKNISGHFVILIMGAFEVFVFFIEKDYTLLAIAPFLAILAGIIGIATKNKF